MPYELAISRYPVSWQDGPKIMLTEWLAYVEQDSELTVVETIDYDVSWQGPNGEVGYLGYRPHGELKCRYYKPFIAKMVRIADDLHAVVRGDNDELYLAGGVVLREDDPETLVYLASKFPLSEMTGENTAGTE